MRNKFKSSIILSVLNNNSIFCTKKSVSSVGAYQYKGAEIWKPQVISSDFTMIVLLRCDLIQKNTANNQIKKHGLSGESG